MAAISENWWVSFRNPLDIWQNHPSYLLLEIFTIFTALLTLRHACRLGGRYPYIWVSTVLHGFAVEAISYLVPDIDNFWHAQSMVIFLGRRLPLHIICFYPSFLYTAFVSVSRLHLKRWAEPFAMGLAVVLLDVPFDIMGVKLLWWTWHDTDPNIYDRHYWVPWTSYYFHASFACAFNILFHGTRKLLTSTPGYHADWFPKEVLCCLVVGAFSMPLGVLQFIPMYHPLHDNLNIHTEVCVLVLLATYALIVWSSDRNPDRNARNARNGPKSYFDEILVQVVLHYLFYVVLSIVEKPEKIRSVGLHEKVGDCESVSPVYTTFMQMLSKRTYLCVKNYDENYFDFHCTTLPNDGSDWYEICGTAFPNHAEYVVVVAAFCALGLFVYCQILFCSGKPHGGMQRLKKAKSN